MTERPFHDILDFSATYDALIPYPKEVEFKSVTKSMAQNETWRDTTSDNLWSILTACGKDIHNIVSSAAIDYVQNISDINTARIPALHSMAHMLKYDTGSLMSLYNAFPSGLKLLVDMFSVDREYLFGGDSPMLSIPMVRKMMERMKVTLMQLTGRTTTEDKALSDIFTEIKENGHWVSADKYRALVKEIFYLFILDVLSARYCESKPTLLVNNLLFQELADYKTYRALPEDTILDKVVREESTHPLDLEETKGSNIPLDPSLNISVTGDSLAEQVENMRIQFNVSKSFNAFAIASEINEHGFSPNNELTSNEKILVETVLNAHNKEMFDYAAGCYCLGEIDTRYGYYRELEFMKYLKVFTMMRSFIVQYVTMDTVSMQEIDTVASSKKELPLRVLDYFTYVQNDWVYDDSGTQPEKFVDENGLGVALMEKPISLIPCKPKFIPRVGAYGRKIRADIGYEYDWLFAKMDRRVLGDADDDSILKLEEDKPEDILENLAEAFTDLVFKIHYLRNELKRQAQFNAMRGTGSLLAHAINDFLLSKYPYQKFTSFIPKWAPIQAYENALQEIMSSEDDDVVKIEKVNNLLNVASEKIGLYRNYTNVDIIEYMDTTDYFNIQPSSIYTNDDDRITTRYWEQALPAITDPSQPQIGQLTPNEIQDFYRNGLSMGHLHAVTKVKDDIEEFLVSLYESGAGEIYYDQEKNALIHPVNDTSNADALFAYDTRSDREKVQNNTALLEKQEKQFLRYSSDTSMNKDFRDRNGLGQVIEAYNWKNSQFASVMLHPFLYTFELWDPLVNILINAMSEYVTEELEKSLSNKKVFDELYGTYGESKDFWKYNIPDFTGYMTRYEHEKHNLSDSIGEISPVTGYDGIFYPSAIREFVDAYELSKNMHGSFEKYMLPKVYLDIPGDSPKFQSIFLPWQYKKQEEVDEQYVSMCHGFDWNRGFDAAVDLEKTLVDEGLDPHDIQTLQQVIAGIYWQVESWPSDKSSVEIRDTKRYQTFYGRWISHLGYSDEKCKRLAKQLWYWKDRIVDAAKHRYEVCNYNLDIANNSMFLMDTFHEEGNAGGEIPYAIDSLDKALQSTNDLIDLKVCVNDSLNHGRCISTIQRPKELWVRWNGEPIAMPAFDVWWDNDRLEERIGFYEDDESKTEKHEVFPKEDRHTDFGQIPYKNSTTNDAINDIVERFLDCYQLDGSMNNLSIGNKIPVFYSFEQNADTIIFSMWDKDKLGKTILGDGDRTHLCPVHVLCKEVRNSDGIYNFEKLFEDMPTIDFVGETADETLLSPQQIFNRSRGSIIIPAYRYKVANGSELMSIAAKEIICQTISNSNYETKELIQGYDSKFINLRLLPPLGDDVSISRGSSVVFSIDENKIGFAFLGGMKETAEDIVCTTETGGQAKYFSDSDPVERTALIRKRYHDLYGQRDTEVPDPNYVPGQSTEYKWKKIGNYADLRLVDRDKADDFDDAIPLHNSFDRNDKFLCVVRFNKELTTDDWNNIDQVASYNSFNGRLLNITSDASYLPTFACQSPNGFDDSSISGISRLYNSEYLKGKDHWAIELLGLENPGLTELMDIAKKLIIHDETDDVDTYVNPRRISDGLYRVWEHCNNKIRKRNVDGTYTYEELPNLEKLYNPNLTFDRNGVATWKEQWMLSEKGKVAFLCRVMSIVRCNEKKDGEALNEKNWFMQETEISQLLSDITKRPSEDGFTPLPLDDFYTAALEHGGATYQSTSHVLSGTQDPFANAQNPDWPVTLRSPVYLLQYGNGIPGVRKMDFNFEIRTLNPNGQDDEMKMTSGSNPIYYDYLSKRKRGTDDWARGGDPDATPPIPAETPIPYIATMTIRFFKHDEEMESRESEDISTFMNSVSMIPAKSILLGISEREVERLADYHMLTHHDDIFYNIPFPNEDEVLRDELHLIPYDPPPSFFVNVGDKGTVTLKNGTYTITATEGNTLTRSDFHFLLPASNYDLSIANDGKSAKAVSLHPEEELARLPRNFTDYLYIHEGSTAFKIDEQSETHYTSLWDRPLMEIRRLLLNFRRNQLNCNGILPWSTFITEEHKHDLPDDLPFQSLDIRANPGVDVKVKEEYMGETSDFKEMILDNSTGGDDVCKVSENATAMEAFAQMNTKGYTLHSWENTTDADGTIIVPVEVAAEEFKDLYKIYAQYEKVDGGFKLFFNVQNLFKPPFEYISSVTNQPMPLIPKDSYLCLDCEDRYNEAGEKIASTSGKLTLYAQMKWLVNDITSTMKLIPLATYDIYNISDDKPKFLLKKSLDCGQVSNTSPTILLNIEDVHIYLDDDDINEAGELTKPISVVQSLSTWYNASNDPYAHLDKMSFTLIQNDTSLSGGEKPPVLNIPMSLAYCYPIDENCAKNNRPYTERNADGSPSIRKYPLRLNTHGGISIKKADIGNSFSYTYKDSGFTNEEVYLYWTMPAGMNVMDSLSKLGCAFECDVIKASATMKDGTSATVVSNRGHVYIDRIGNKKFLAREHGKHMNKHGFILVRVSNKLKRINVEEVNLKS